MKTRILLYLTLGLLFTSCTSQNDRIENVIMKCSYQSFDDKGKAFKALIDDYENLLIDENIIPDRSGKSYRQVFLKVASGNEFNKVPSKFFATEMQKLEKPDMEKARKCQKIIDQDSLSYDVSKLKGLEQAMINAQKSLDLQPSTIAKEILDVLTEEDFELDFYKMRAFLLFSLVDTNAGIAKKLQDLPDDDSELDLSNAIHIYIDGDNQMFVNKEKVTLKKLRTAVKKYEKKNKSTSIIALKAERATEYAMYIQVQNAILRAIRELRVQLSKEKYNKELEKLTKEELDEIKKVYPQKIIDQM